MKEERNAVVARCSVRAALWCGAVLFQVLYPCVAEEKSAMMQVLAITCLWLYHVVVRVASWIKILVQHSNQVSLRALFEQHEPVTVKE